MQNIEIRTTVAAFNGVLREAGTNNYYRCEPSNEDPNIVILSMPKVKGDRSTYLEAIRFTLVGREEGERIVYIKARNELSHWWEQRLAAVMSTSQALA